MGRHCLDVSRSGIGHCACPRGCGSGVAEREIDAEAKEEAGTETELETEAGRGVGEASTGIRYGSVVQGVDGEKWWMNRPQQHVHRRRERMAGG